MRYYANMDLTPDLGNYNDPYEIFSKQMYDTFQENGNLLISQKRFNNGMETVWKKSTVMITRKRGRPRKEVKAVEDELKRNRFTDYLCKVFNVDKIIIREETEKSTGYYEFENIPCYILEKENLNINKKV